MDNFIRKRIDIATCWATNRISAMDTLERYEDSYAIAEEFREWILHIGEKNENYWVGQVIDCIGGARNPNSWTLFQVANIDNGEITIINADIVEKILKPSGS